MAIIGYARVSSFGQSLDLQVEKLKAYGCKKTAILSELSNPLKSILIV